MERPGTSVVVVAKLLVVEVVDFRGTEQRHEFRRAGDTMMELRSG
jgi:hypothetical protein